MSRRGRLAPGDYVFLCFLLNGPRTAYDVKKDMARRISDFWTASHSQIYQQATRLVRDGWVQEEDAEGPRRKRLLSLTHAGQEVVRTWLTSESPLPGFFAEANIKILFASHAGDLAGTIAMMRDQQTKTSERLDRYLEIKHSIKMREDLEFPSMVLDVGIALTEAALRWETETLAKLRKMADSSKTKKSKRPARQRRGRSDGAL